MTIFDMDSIYAELISNVLQFNNYSAIFYFDPVNEGKRCYLENGLSILARTIPIILWRTMKFINLSRFIHADLLVLACLPGIYRQNLLNILSNNLRYMRQANLLIELSMDQGQDSSIANQIFQYCLQKHMINTALLFSDFGQTHNVYSFEVYPIYRLNDHKFTKDFFNLYPDKMINLHGSPLRTLPDYSEPNTILYFDNEGRPQVLGYVWNMLQAYSRKHNARLQLNSDYQKGKPLSQMDVMNLMRDNIVDIPASVFAMTFVYVYRYHEFAYPVDMPGWCTMLPVRPLIDVPELYATLIPTMTLIFLAFLWLIYEILKSRRNHNYQQNHLRSIAWSILGAFLACYIYGILATLFIEPPAEQPIKSFQDLYNSKVHIFGLRAEYNAYEFEMRTKYASLFYLSENPLKYLRLRNSLNTSFAYSVTHTKWQIYAEQQARWSRPLFYYSKDLCFYQTVPFGLMIPENSPHRANLNHFMLQIRESGLYMHWVSKGFYYMVQAGRMRMQDRGEERHIRPISTQDLLTVLVAYMGGMLISFALFVCELITQMCCDRT